MSRILVTGATGFVGNWLCVQLVKQGYTVRAALRQSPSTTRMAAQEQFTVGSINSKTHWAKALADTDYIVHLASRVHVMRDSSPGSATAFHEINVRGTLNLACQAAAANVRRFIYLSSIKVNGEETVAQPFKPDDLPAPQDAYGQSKQEAEQELFRVAEETGLGVVIIRPPLVYGPNVKANFFRLLYWVKKGIPLPLGMVNNRRSLVSLDNLIDLIETCIIHPAATGEIFLVSDGEDLSTPELIQRLAKSMNRPARLIPVPEKILRFGGKLIGKSFEVVRLCNSLQVDISKTTEVLGWSRPLSVDEGLKKTVDWFMKND